MPPSADVLLKDAPSDTGAEPFIGQPFWESPDIAVRQTDDDVFADQPALQGCGPPTGRAPTRHIVTFQQTGLGLEEIVIDVERWLYDRGPGQFTRVLTFRNGYVDTIGLAGYGES